MTAHDREELPGGPIADPGRTGTFLADERIRNLESRILGARESIVRHDRTFRILASILGSISFDPRRESLVYSVIESLCDGLRASLAFFAEPAPGGGPLRGFAVRFRDDGRAQILPVALPPGFPGGDERSALDRGEPVVLRDRAVWRESDLELAAGPPVHLAPVRTGGSFEALLGAAADGDESANPDIPGVLEIVSAALGTALENAQRLSGLAEGARKDALTGIASRLELMAAIGDAGRSRLDRPFALLLVDLDHFKSVNDTLGHLSGDRTLIQVSRALRASVSHGDVVGRLAGDEFGVLLRRVSLPEARTAAMDLLLALDGVFDAGEWCRIRERLGASIGLCFWDGGPIRPEAVLAHADASLYAAKKAGRHRLGPAAPYEPGP